MTGHRKIWAVVALLYALTAIAGTVEAHALYPPPRACQFAEVCVASQPPPPPTYRRWR